MFICNNVQLHYSTEKNFSEISRKKLTKCKNMRISLRNDFPFSLKTLVGIWVDLDFEVLIASS